MSTRRFVLSVLAAFSLALFSAAPLFAVEKTAPKEKIDINNATEKELEDTLPGVGKVTAKKIVDGRPYKAGKDLVDAGVSQKVVDEITPMIVFGKAAAKTAKPDDKTTAKPDDK